MNTRTLLASVMALGLLAACSKPEPVVDAPRPVVVFTLAPAQVAPIALYTGEVRARYESDLAFRIGGKNGMCAHEGSGTAAPRPRRMKSK